MEEFNPEGEETSKRPKPSASPTLVLDIEDSQGPQNIALSEKLLESEIQPS